MMSDSLMGEPSLPYIEAHTVVHPARLLEIRFEDERKLVFIRPVSLIRCAYSKDMRDAGLPERIVLPSIVKIGDMILVE